MEAAPDYDKNYTEMFAEVYGLSIICPDRSKTYNYKKYHNLSNLYDDAIYDFGHSASIRWLLERLMRALLACAPVTCISNFSRQTRPKTHVRARLMTKYFIINSNL